MRSHNRRRLYPLCLLPFLSLISESHSHPQTQTSNHVSPQRDTFTDTLYVKPLPDGSVYSSFLFKLTTPSVKLAHSQLFPLSLTPDALLALDGNGSTSLDELHLTLTRGRWHTQRWGYPPRSRTDGALGGGDGNGRAAGVEIVAWLSSPDNTDGKEQAFPSPGWKTLTNALAGTFCASLNRIDSTHTTSPLSTFPSTTSSGRIHHAYLPNEFPCTENLTPFVKMLPCRTRAGVAALLNPKALFDAEFSSVGVHLRRVPNGGEGEEGLELTLEIRGVRDPVRLDKVRGSLGRRDWSLSMLFDRKLSTACPVSERSSVILDTSLAGAVTVRPEGLFSPSSSASSPHLLELELESPSPGSIHSNSTAPLDIALSWQEARFYYPTTYPPPPIEVTRVLNGYAQQLGELGVQVVNHLDKEMEVRYMESLPWWLEVYISTLRTKISPLSASEGLNATAHTYASLDPTASSVSSLSYIPARSRLRPTQLEAVLLLPALSRLTLTFNFERAFLFYTEYPPDANRGFDVPPAVVAFQEKSEQQTLWRRIYTTTTLVSMPVPDFSMPYNVIILTSTVMTLFFGALCNILVRSFVVVKIKQDKAEEEEKKKERSEEDVVKEE